MAHRHNGVSKFWHMHETDGETVGRRAVHKQPPKVGQLITHTALNVSFVRGKVNREN